MLLNTLRLRTMFTVPALLWLSCSLLPFLPETGTPVVPESPLRTPQGTIQQLLNSYETRRIDLFEAAFQSDSFRFYVATPFFTEYQSNPSGILQTDSIGTQFTYVPARNYNYWLFENELRSHRNLFNSDRTLSITFTLTPYVNPDDFVYHFSLTGDTIGVEVLMLDGTFTVEYPDPLNDLSIISQPVAIERQVFYLVRNTSGDWLIKKWFDMGSAQ